MAKSKSKLDKGVDAPNEEKKYSLTLTLSDKTYSATGDTVLEAITQIKPEKIRSKGVFTVTKGTQKKEGQMFVIKLKHLLGNNLAKIIWSHRIEKSFI